MKRMISLVLALMLFCLPCALAETVDSTAQATTGRLTVTASSTISLPADTAMITLGVRESAENVQDAQSVVNEKIAAIRAALVELGIDNKDITTESMFVYANYNYDSGAEEIVSYNASNTLCITVRELDNSGSVIDTAFAAGANTLESVNFHAVDVTKAKDQAYADAVANAMHKAQIIADASGVKLDGIVDIIESGDNDYYYYDNGAKLRANAMVSGADAAGADIQASSVLVSANVTITYAISE